MPAADVRHSTSTVSDRYFGWRVAREKGIFSINIHELRLLKPPCSGSFPLYLRAQTVLQAKGFPVTKSVFYTILISLGGIPGFLFSA